MDRSAEARVPPAWSHGHNGVLKGLSLEAGVQRGAEGRRLSLRVLRSSSDRHRMFDCQVYHAYKILPECICAV